MTRPPNRLYYGDNLEILCEQKPLYRDRVSWAVTYLMQAGFLERPKRTVSNGSPRASSGAHRGTRTRRMARREGRHDTDTGKQRGASRERRIMELDKTFPEQIPPTLVRHPQLLAAAEEAARRGIEPLVYRGYRDSALLSSVVLWMDQVGGALIAEGLLPARWIEGSSLRDIWQSWNEGQEAEGEDSHAGKPPSSEAPESGRIDLPGSTYPRSPRPETGD